LIRYIGILLAARKVRRVQSAFESPQIIKLLGALVLLGIAMGFRSDVTESWLRATLAIAGFGILGWGIAQMFVKEK